MNNIEKIAQIAIPEQGGALAPLQRVNDGMLGFQEASFVVSACPSFLIAATGAASSTGLEDSRLVESVPSGGSSAELLSIRASGMRA
ncbi:hypothetical protein [Saccharomonospora sp.]|uniref:hypothetical protein n=1 Tax=Saccharomonospora sp. TaxID=33913 RepID=UPI00260646B2|nr:hypothetical protein [Saccharomonospora sp.]